MTKGKYFREPDKFLQNLNLMVLVLLEVLSKAWKPFKKMKPQRARKLFW